MLSYFRLISVGFPSQFCAPRLKIALDSWTDHETGNAKVARVFAVDIDTNNKQEHCCCYEFL